MTDPPTTPTDWTISGDLSADALQALIALLESCDDAPMKKAEWNFESEDKK